MKQIHVFWAGMGTGFCITHVIILLELTLLKVVGIDNPILLAIPAGAVGFWTLWKVSDMRHKGASPK